MPAVRSRSPRRAPRGAKSPAIREKKPPSLDPLVHEPVRLAILGALRRGGTLTFGELKGVVQATDGNLSAHAARLEAAGFLIVRKSFEGRVPRTAFRLTPSGRNALRGYARAMRALLAGLPE